MGYIMGPEVSMLEDALTKYTESKNCITVASGTEALLISLMALGIGRGDEVITTPFTFISTVEVIALLGAKPIFVDIDASTCNIDHHLIEEKISNRTKAIIPVSLYGQTAELNAINLIAEKYNIPVIEDAAQSFGATHHGKKSCNISTIGCTSFFPSKPLGCYGDGGAIFTNDQSIADAAREIRVHGQSKRYHHTRIGVGGRMDTLQCAVVLAKLKNFDEEVLQRQKIAKTYMEAFDSAGINNITIHPHNTSVFAQFTIIVENRDKIIDKLTRNNIPFAIHYPTPLNKQPAYSHLCCDDCTPISDKIAHSVLSLPMSPYLKFEDQNLIIDTIIG